LFFLPGEVEVSVRDGEWEESELVNVRDGKAALVSVHRDPADEPVLQGHVVDADGNPIRERVNLRFYDTYHHPRGFYASKIDEKFASLQDGTFSKRFRATAGIVYAETDDGAMAGTATYAAGNHVVVPLRATTRCLGQLVHEDLTPVSTGTGRASMRLFAHDFIPKGAPWGSALGDLHKRNVPIDELGRFEIDRLPRDARLSLVIDTGRDMGERWISSVGNHHAAIKDVANSNLPKDGRASERRSLNMVRERRSRLSRKGFLERLEIRRLDAEPFDAGVLLIVVDDPNRLTGSLIGGLDAAKERWAGGYIPLVVSTDEIAAHEGGAVRLSEWLKNKRLSMPVQGEALFVWMAGDEQSDNHLIVDLGDPDFPKQVAERGRKQVKESSDALKKLRRAKKRAAENGRRVWLNFGHARSHETIRLVRWFRDHHDLLDQEYVGVFVDVRRDENGKQLAEEFGFDPDDVPAYVLLRPDGEVLQDSRTAIGNTGFPEDVKSRNQLEHVLRRTAEKLTDEQLLALMEKE
ncbi:MAG: thioredoxin family protein, partial [Planctomycetota bacterium]